MSRAIAPGPVVARLDDLVEQVGGRLFGLAYRLLGNAADAEDVVQEAFIKVSADPVLARPVDEIAAWLRRVCLNLAANRIRAATRERARLLRSAELERPSRMTEDPSDSVTRDETRDDVRLVLGLLPERQRDCLLLRHSGHSYAEIAATLGIAIGSVGVLLARAERAFRLHFCEHSSASGVGPASSVRGGG
jgi:RNA polymerase sigma-70 factor (ECF subfamily)